MVYAERGISAPPEVVFNTATDPDRSAAWLPEPLRSAVRDGDSDGLRARWRSRDTDWTAELKVTPQDTGGTRAGLDLSGAGQPDRLADEALANLAREVADNLQAG
ncbi:SRPBCC family protein [Micromonospora sp. NPDC048871]|uniref:SRPBCC family protein n=1 Tax=unclassified Micromonospora TaxID=2617518 RepID=UPI002E15CF61|nr:SRPBCC family protein [Micromonospora sp. NBC_01739]